MKVRGQQQEDHHNREQDSTPQPGQRFFEGRHLAAVEDVDTPRRRAGSCDRLSHVIEGLTQRFPFEVGGKTDDALHVVPVDLARCDSIIDRRHVRDQRASEASGVAPHHRQVFHVLDGRHPRLRNLDLNLKPVAASGVAPEIQVGVPTRRRGGHERSGNFARCDAELSGPIAVDLDLEARIIEWLRV